MAEADRGVVIEKSSKACCGFYVPARSGRSYRIVIRRARHAMIAFSNGVEAARCIECFKRWPMIWLSADS